MQRSSPRIDRSLHHGGWYMTRTVATLFAVALVSSLSTPLLAQDTKSARGLVTAMTASAVTVKAGNQEMTFTVDAKTMVTADGGSTAHARPQRPEARSPARRVDRGRQCRRGQLSRGQRRHACRANPPRIDSGCRRRSTSDQPAEMSNGTVDAISATSLTITGSASGGATFKQTFTIDRDTKVVAQGASTASAASGGKLQITDVVGSGDTGTVNYSQGGESHPPAEVRVRQKRK